MEDEKTIERRINDILSEQLGLEPADRFGSDSKLAEDLGADSLDLVEIALAIESEFQDLNLDIAEKEIEAWNTVGDVVRFIEDKYDQ